MLDNSVSEGNEPVGDVLVPHTDKVAYGCTIHLCLSVFVCATYGYNAAHGHECSTELCAPKHVTLMLNRL